MFMLTLPVNEFDCCCTINGTPAEFIRSEDAITWRYVDGDWSMRKILTVMPADSELNTFVCEDEDMAVPITVIRPTADLSRIAHARLLKALDLRPKSLLRVQCQCEPL